MRGLSREPISARKIAKEIELPHPVTITVLEYLQFGGIPIDSTEWRSDPLWKLMAPETPTKRELERWDSQRPARNNETERERK